MLNNFNNKNPIKKVHHHHLYLLCPQDQWVCSGGLHQEEEEPAVQGVSKEEVPQDGHEGPVVTERVVFVGCCERFQKTTIL